MIKRTLALTFVAALLVGSLSCKLLGQPRVDKLVLADTIQPISQAALTRALDRATHDNAQALLVVIDTPGGLLDSTRTMAGGILASRVPVLLYVAPAGARAGSAGFFLLEAADVAAMAPGTNAGAAHPVTMFGGQPDETMRQKLENDTEAFLRSYVTKRNRNAQAAQEAVHSSRSYTADEALAANLIDLVANDETELLNKLDGREITRMDGTRMTLHLKDAHVQTIEPELREKLLGWLVNPNIALLFFFAGAMLVYLEFNSPGTIVPGALGTLMVLLSIFALNLLPIRYTSVMLVVAALVLLALEAKFGGHGVLAVAGILALTFGLLTLVSAPIPELAVSPWVAVAVGVAFGGITAVLLRLALRARKSKVRLGADAMVGRPAKAMEALSPEGHILVEGEIWRAIASVPVAEGTPLLVTAAEELLLRVEPAPEAKS